MTGNQDKAQRARRHLDALYEDLQPLVGEKLAGHLKATELEPGDSLAAQRYARAIDLTVKCGLTLSTLQISKGTRAAAPKSEDDMSDDDADDSPETLDRLRADLERRLARVQSLLDRKGLVVEPGCWPTSRPGQERIRSS